MKLDSMLLLALDACEAAAKAILTAKNALQIWQKDDKSPLSSADLASNAILCDMLSKSDIALCSEEKPLSFAQRKKLEYFWLIDPLDGTKGFIKGSDEYCILIALIHHQRPVLALIKQPSTGDCFYAHKESLVYKNKEVLKIETQDFEKHKNIALISAHHPNAQNQIFLEKNKLNTLKIGSALKFKSLLEAKAGVYVRFESLNSWDLAAGDFLINQSGGLMQGFDKKPLLYNQADFLCKGFVATSKKEYFKDLNFA